MPNFETVEVSTDGESWQQLRTPSGSDANPRGNNPGWDPNFLLSRSTWDLIHTWSGVVATVAAVVHFAIHWRWVKNVSRKFFVSLLPQPQATAKPAAKQTVPASNR